MKTYFTAGLSVLRSLLHPRQALRRCLHVRPRAFESDPSVAVPLRFVAVHSDMRIAMVIHLFHADMAGRFSMLISAAGFPIDVLVTTDTDEKAAQIRSAFNSVSSATVTITVVPNIGRDIAPKLITYASEYQRYDLLLFLHSKKSTHLSTGGDWAESTFSTLIGSADIANSIITLFGLAPELGLVFPQHFPDIREYLIWNTNLAKARILARRLGFRLSPRAPLDFPAGSMFWARPAALRPLIDLQLSYADFAAELGQTEGTLAHSIERLFLHSTELAGYQWLKIQRREAAHDGELIVDLNGPEELRVMLKRDKFRVLPMVSR